mmetsp:Transcript_16707/g.57001  ORF Transcript_16707/g.57001 Transcript_16707/m.57001 type:complete len:92 (-) Transcript_16707:141-416(-)
MLLASLLAHFQLRWRHHRGYRRMSLPVSKCHWTTVRCGESHFLHQQQTFPAAFYFHIYCVPRLVAWRHLVRNGRNPQSKKSRVKIVRLGER